MDESANIPKLPDFQKYFIFRDSLDTNLLPRSSPRPRFLTILTNLTPPCSVLTTGLLSR